MPSRKHPGIQYTGSPGKKNRNDPPAINAASAKRKSLRS